MPIFPHNSITKEATAHYQLNDLYKTMSTEMPDHIHLLLNILSPTTSYPIAGMSRSQISYRLPPIPFALNMRRKLQIPILPYECKCQWNKVYNIYGDHPFNCPKNHKGRPHNMITNKSTVKPGSCSIPCNNSCSYDTIKINNIHLYDCSASHPPHFGLILIFAHNYYITISDQPAGERGWFSM
jgi:hypothetical protein